MQPAALTGRTTFSKQDATPDAQKCS